MIELLDFPKRLHVEIVVFQSMYEDWKCKNKPDTMQGFFLMYLNFLDSQR